MIDEERNKELKSIGDSIKRIKVGNSFEMLEETINAFFNEKRRIFTHKKEEYTIDGKEGCGTFNAYRILAYDGRGSIMHCYYCDGSYYSEKPEEDNSKE